MIELIVIGGLLWWIGKKGKAAFEDTRVSEGEWRLAQLTEKHRIPYETSDGSLLTWEQPSPDPDQGTRCARPDVRIEFHDNRSIHQHLHVHLERRDED